MQQDIEPCSVEESRPWSYIVSLQETEALEILQEFNAEAVRLSLMYHMDPEELTQIAPVSKLATLPKRCHAV